MIKISATFIITVFCLRVATAGDGMSAAAEKCQNTYGITDPTSIMKEKSMTLKDENNVDGRCFCECLMTEFGILKQDGSLDVNAVMLEAKTMMKYAEKQGIKVDENQLKSSVTECGKKGGDGKCMKSYKMWECLCDLATKTMGTM
ncbi:uncharacterized protein [Periplaneta americana]|uniref:uncharacterized protein n=1 Tax=Periplaneta americana TaxID=6978 RepID=UPI0037E7C2A0